ncbi:MAG: hypothetical protein II163_06940 [Ruminococcus sp.]|nr:hypothetical protein [Ruminococcus sp.]MBQ1898890.1 hypothetical protein [Ruminococcus sp.]
MKNSGLIIKIAVGIAGVAVIFSLVTLIRSIVIGGTVVFPIIQLVGSAAIFAICFLMFRTLKANGAEEEETDEQEADEQEETAANEDKAEEQQSDAENAVDEAYEKYDLSEFEEK